MLLIISCSCGGVGRTLKCELTQIAVTKEVVRHKDVAQMLPKHHVTMPRSIFCVTFWLYPCSWEFGVSVGENVLYWSANTRGKVMEVRLEGEHSWYTEVRGPRQWGSAGRHQAITQRRGSRLHMGKLQETSKSIKQAQTLLNILFWCNRSALQAATQQCYILYLSKYCECQEIVLNKPRTELYKWSPFGQNC